MRAYMPGEPVEAYLIEMTNELATAHPTTGSFVPPRLTAAEITAFTGMTAGAVVYDTTNNLLKYYNGTAWGTV